MYIYSLNDGLDLALAIGCRIEQYLFRNLSVTMFASLLMQLFLKLEKMLKLGSLALSFRFRLHFEKESKEEVERRKKLAMETVLQQVSDKELEVSINEIYPSDKG